MQDPLAAYIAPSPLAVKFAIKSVIGGFLALWLAMRFGLSQPQWAMMTAFIVAQPLSGMVVQKGFARLIGTIAGTTMSVVFMALFNQAPWLFLLSVALWLWLCTAAATMLRSAWAYSFVLSGYTVAIIGLPSISHPLGVFSEAVARCTEISLGILCASFVSVILWPIRVEKQLVQQAEEAWRTGIISARQALSDESLPRKGLLEMLGRIIAVDAQREHAWFEGRLGRNRAQALRLLSRDLLGVLRLSRGVTRQWRQLSSADAKAIEPWLIRMREALEHYDQSDWPQLHEQLQEASRDEQWLPAQQQCLERLAVMVLMLKQAEGSLLAVAQGRASNNAPPPLSWHSDWQTAAAYGGRSALAFLLVTGFWMATAWPSAAGATLLTCVVCSLFANRDNAAQLGMMFLRGTLYAVPVAFVSGQLLMPLINDFELLCLAMGVPLFFGALGMAKPTTGAVATSFCLQFIVLTLVNVRANNNMAFFSNESIGLLIGCSCAVLAFKLIELRNPHWHGRRLIKATARDLALLARQNLIGAQNWFGGRMADRLVQLARFYPVAPGKRRDLWEEGIAALDLGDEILHLRACLGELKANLGPAWPNFAKRFEEVVAAGPAVDREDALNEVAARLYEALNELPPSSHRRLAQAALGQLRAGWRKWCVLQGELHGAT
ncbi:FUSC family protein [Pseudomonas sp. 5P_3.1_Bac2]|uniref:FUSC family protein n=1 Tax=Pseudomonas sp. 5P_3.1_Bac2 TaxID=2971617 RepID=UPI0021C963D7|nr:FUSC family protein [Pseudomonas sp. 5P_3.1_Bac2]MCU1718990.1 FUSC family protein [Pseudomonas sp. 5P_3.1_Bac2]